MDCINNKINSFDVDNPDFEELSYIFDLVQAWGGVMGKMPYIKHKSLASSSRDNLMIGKILTLRGSNLH